MAPPRVSAIIPTYQRPADLRLALASVVAQTYPAEALEIIVVDDGSADDGAARVCAELGDRDELAAAEDLEADPVGVHALDVGDDHADLRPARQQFDLAGDLGRPPLVVVVEQRQVRAGGRGHAVVARRRHAAVGLLQVAHPVDGWVLPHVLRNPALAPASAMLRREVFTATGGFDTTLRTAEDLDFHLRVAARFQIAVIAEPLTRAMRGHQGLSALARTNRDYVDAVERFVRDHAGAIAPQHRAAALFWAYARNARGALATGTWNDAARLAVWAALHARNPAEARELGRLGLVMSKNAVVRARRRLGGR